MRIKLVKRKNPMKKSEEKYYANPVNLGKKTLKDIAKDIAGRSSLTRGDIENVLSNVIDRLPSYLRDGFSVQLSDFGTMRLTLSSEGSLTEKAFNIEKIKPRVTFTPSTELKKELADNSYETVKKDDEEKKKKEEGGTPSHP